MKESTRKPESTLNNGNRINKDTQFGGPKANPSHSGAWKKADTPRYKLEQMMKLSPAALDKVLADEEAPLFEHKLAEALKKGEWKQIESMVNQVYGTPKQTQDITTGGEKLQPLMVRFLDDSRDT